jgi:membrane protein DedA with SNARE-associated domain
MEAMSGLLAQYGLALVFLNVFLHQAGVPVTAMPLLVVTGALAQQGQLQFVPLLGVAVAASLLGDTPWYFAGRRFGYRVLRTLCRIAIEPDSCVKQTENIFERWGAPSLLVAKFIPGFSTVAPPLAGAMRLPFASFLAYSAAGAAIWSGTAIGLGVVFHAEIDAVLTWLEESGPGVLTAIATIVALYAAVKWTERWMFIRMLRAARISAKDLNGLLAGGNPPIVLDVRSAIARKHDPRSIPGAIVVDIEAPQRHLAGVPPEREIVVYCT